MFVKPEFAAFQLIPLFVERKTPPSVPAKRKVPLARRQFTVPPHGPLVCTH
jgi:hypothetical protein